MSEDEDEDRRDWRKDRPQTRGRITASEHREHVANNVVSIGCVFCRIVKR